MILLPRLSIVMKLYEGRVSVCSRLVTFKMGETSHFLNSYENYTNKHYMTLPAAPYTIYHIPHTIYHIHINISIYGYGYGYGCGHGYGYGYRCIA